LKKVEVLFTAYSFTLATKLIGGPRKKLNTDFRFSAKNFIGIPILIVLLSTSLKAHSESKINPKAHAACLDARDYSGCVGSFSNGVQKGSVNEKCWLSGRQKPLLGRARE
jgi:hypothetical protein